MNTTTRQSIIENVQERTNYKEEGKLKSNNEK